MTDIFKPKSDMEAALLRKKFRGINVLGVTGGVILVNEHEETASGSYDQIISLLDAAKDHEDFWSALKSAGLVRLGNN